MSESSIHQALFSVTQAFFVHPLPAFDASKLLQQPAFSISSPESLWHGGCAIRLLKGDQQSMESLATRTPVKSSHPESIDWPIVTFWLTYLGMVFGIICAFISDGL
jgi:hypothetical protein